MKLNIPERISILKILPKEGNFAILKILNSLIMSLSPSEEEHKEFGINIETSPAGQRITWGDKGHEEREIEIGEKAADIIIGELKKLDEAKKLTNEHFSLYEKFVK